MPARIGPCLPRMKVFRAKAQAGARAGLGLGAITCVLVAAVGLLALRRRPTEITGELVPRGA